MRASQAVGGGSHNAARSSQEEVSDGKLLAWAVTGVILQWWDPGGKPGPLTAFQERAHSPCVPEVTWRAHCRNADLSQLEAKGGLVVPLSSGWDSVGLTLRLDSAPKRRSLTLQAASCSHPSTPGKARVVERQDQGPGWHRGCTQHWALPRCWWAQGGRGRERVGKAQWRLS